MLRLCGFPVSNYYNKVKFALLEKGVPFAEEAISPSQDEPVLKDSPMGKVPFLRTDRGALSESQVLIEYIEEVYPDTPLYPRDPFARAKCRELIEHLELHVELPARRLYLEAFFNGQVSDETKREVEKLLTKGLKSLARLVRFAPFVASDGFTQADCAAFVHLPLVGQATRRIYDRDFLETLLPQAADYLRHVGARPHARKVNADRKAAMDVYFTAKKG